MSSSPSSSLSSVIFAVEGLLVTPYAVFGLGATTLALLAATYYLSSLSRSSSSSSDAASSKSNRPHPPPPLSSSSSSSPATAPSRASSSAGRIGVEGGDDDGRRGSRTDEVEELDATVSSEQRGRHPTSPLTPVCLVRLAFVCMALPPPRNTLSTRIPFPPIHPSFHLDAVVVASSSSHRHLFLLKCDLSSSVVRRS